MASTGTTPDSVVRSSNSQPKVGHGRSISGRPNVSWLTDTQTSWDTRLRATAQTIGLHLGDGSLPSGNTAGISANRRVNAGNQTQPRSHRARPVAGNRLACV